MARNVRRIHDKVSSGCSASGQDSQNGNTGKSCHGVDKQMRANAGALASSTAAIDRTPDIARSGAGGNEKISSFFELLTEWPLNDGKRRRLFDPGHHVVGKFDGKAHEPPVKIEIPET